MGVGGEEFDLWVCRGGGVLDVGVEVLEGGWGGGRGEGTYVFEGVGCWGVGLG